MGVKFTLHLEEFRFYKRVSFMCLISSFLPQHLKTHPSGNPSYAINFPYCTDALYYLFILHHFTKEQILPLDARMWLPLA